jgi:hypothetical protein
MRQIGRFRVTAKPEVILRARDDMPVTKYADLDEIRADRYSYWQSRPAHERLDRLNT